MRGLAPIAMLVALAAAGTAEAEVRIGNPWIRSVVAGDASTPAYMDIRSEIGLRLVGATSPWAGKIELHAVEIKDGRTVERVVTALEVPANGELRLAPGGNYLAVSAIKRGFGNGDYVPITLRFEDDKGTPHTVDVNAQARGMTLSRPPAANPQ